MATIYIFEGPDRVGKTTIARSWAAAHNTEVTHFGTPDPNQVHPQYQYLSLLRKPNNPQEILVLDRSWISGLFYSVVRRNKKPDWDSVVTLEGQLADLGWKVVYIFVCRPLTPALIMDHLQEMQQGEGYGGIAERIWEHSTWDTFITSIPLDALRFPLLGLYNPTLDIAYENLATGNLPHARLLTVREIPNNSASPSVLFDIWAQQPWNDSVHEGNCLKATR